jgi:hypothetical protein
LGRAPAQRHKVARCNPRLGKSLGHEIAPYLHRHRDFVHWRLVVIADPDASDQEASEADKPGIAEVLTRAGFARRKPI